MPRRYRHRTDPATRFVFQAIKGWGALAGMLFLFGIMALFVTCTLPR